VPTKRRPANAGEQYLSDTALLDWEYRPVCLAMLPPYVMAMFFQRVPLLHGRKKSRTKHLHFRPGHPLAHKFRIGPRRHREPVVLRLIRQPLIRPTSIADGDNDSAADQRDQYAAFVLALFATDEVVRQLPGSTRWEKFLAWEDPSTVIATSGCGGSTSGSDACLQNVLAACCRKIVRNMSMRAAALREGAQASRALLADQRKAEKIAAATAWKMHEGKTLEDWHPDLDCASEDDDDYDDVHFQLDPCCLTGDGDNLAHEIEVEFEAMAEHAGSCDNRTRCVFPLELRTRAALFALRGR
jgi:hypothetical protein